MREAIIRKATEAREAMEKKLKAAFGEVDATNAALLANYEALERLRLEAQERVEQIGIEQRYQNGRQSVTRTNPAISVLLKTSATQAKVVAAMGVKRRRNAEADAEAHQDEAADLDDY